MSVAAHGQPRLRAALILAVAGAALLSWLALWPSAPAAPEAEEHAGHPHPITAEHERLQGQLRLAGALNDALDLEDGARMRPLIERYRALDPADENALGDGYELLADCLEHPGRESQAAAQAYYDRERASTLRRYIRRTCLERPLH